jgi:hypothetical protein
MMLAKIREAQKAVVAAVTPILSALLLDLVADLNEASTVAVVAVFSALAVWATPNVEVE